MQWSNWKSFPDPRKGDYLYAPYGHGVYQLRNRETNELILFGSGKNLANRLTSLLPSPLGQGTRNNGNKRKYVVDHLPSIEYRTLAFISELDMKTKENELRKQKNHLFNT